MPRSRLCLLVLLLLAAASAWAQAYPTGPQVLTFLSSLDDSDQPYALYLPKHFDPARRYPLVVSLHGAWSNHRLNLRRVFGRGNLARETDSEATRYFPEFRDVDFIVACPLARGTMGYQGVGEKDVYDVLADVKRRFPIDDDRVYLTGLSMGGGGTLWLGLTRPDLWAAIAPVCPAIPPGTDELVGNALNLPVRLFHGEADPVVPVGVSRQWHRRLLELGAPAEYVEYPNVRHNSWDQAYRNGAIFDWFAKFRRAAYPERVRWTSRSYRYRSAYWVRLDSFSPGRAASLDVRFLAGNKLAVTTEDLDGFTLNLASHPRFSASAVLEITVDRTPFRRRVARSISFARSPAGWKVGLAEPAAADKRPCAEGPVPAALSDPHLYVYGTAGSPSKEELDRRRDAAARAADWSAPRLRLLLSLPVKADRDVTENDLSTYNLVLFGTSETNTLIRRFSSRLPLALNAGAADYGLVFVFPAGSHYVVVNSGLPWWTGIEEIEPPGLTFLPPAVRLVQSIPDYRLFKGSLSHIVVEGLFDRHWKLPAADAAKMRETGAVVIQ